MFRKYHVDGVQQLKSSVQRGIRAKISDQYPALDDALDDLMPKKATVVIGKCEHKTSVVLVDDSVVLLSVLLEVSVVLVTVVLEVSDVCVC